MRARAHCVQVEARFVGVSFPQGQGLMGRSVPGVTKASMIMALPDVGAAMDRPLQYRWAVQGGAQTGTRRTCMKRGVDAHGCAVRLWRQCVYRIVVCVPVSV